eukprot:11235234-Alexandrium_andersonii.AAC.1
MSASLVGSEMCIRDRDWTSKDRHLMPCLAQACATPPAPENRSRITSAVSYTHLTLPTICSV